MDPRYSYCARLTSISNVGVSKTVLCQACGAKWITVPGRRSIDPASHSSRLLPSSTIRASIKPCDRDNEKAPDYRVTANGVEFGAGWSKTARETGAEYLWLKLDDPSFTAPVYASLVQGDKGEHKLIWSR